MSWAKEFVELSKSKHDRDSFDCGESELNIFLKSQATRHIGAGISRTMVLLPRLLYPIISNLFVRFTLLQLAQ